MTIEPLRGDLHRRLTPVVIERIQRAPKSTKIAEVVVATRELGGMAVSLEEIAEIINIAEPGRNVKARASDYSVAEIEHHPNLLPTRTPRGTFVRYSEGK